MIFGDFLTGFTTSNPELGSKTRRKRPTAKRTPVLRSLILVVFGGLLTGFLTLHGSDLRFTYFKRNVVNVSSENGMFHLWMYINRTVCAKMNDPHFFQKLKGPAFYSRKKTFVHVE